MKEGKTFKKVKCYVVFCNKCFDDLDKKNIIEIEESIKKEFEIETE
jgi:hypothetical protein